MIPPGVLGQVYVVSAAIGVLFIGINVLVGQLGDAGDDGGGGGSDFGAADDGSAGGSDFGAADDSSAGGSDFGASDNGSAGSDLSASHAHGSSIKLAPAATFGHSVGTLLLGLLSPMGIAIYLAFFGLTGIVFSGFFPWLGVFSLIPAILAATAVSYSLKILVQWMMRHMHSSSHAKLSDMVGLIAEVNTPIKDGRLGEVTFVVHSKKMNASAKPAKFGMEIPRGAKVLIVGLKDHLVFVEPCDPLLLGDTVPPDHLH